MSDLRDEALLRLGKLIENRRYNNYTDFNNYHKLVCSIVFD